MKALAARRHHPAALLVILLLALVATGGLYATFAPKDAAANTASASDIEAGNELFLANCATCHGLQAQGTEAGPSLIGVGAAAVDFQVGSGRMPMQTNGPQALVKPPQFDDEETEQLSAYVASLAPGPAIPTAEMTDPEKGDAANGGAIFRVNCAMCHNAAGAGGALTNGKFAPDLMGVSGKHVYEAMQTGPQNMPVFSNGNLNPEEKRDVIAYLDALDENGSPGGLALGSLGPVAEGLYAWVVGLALLIGCAVWIGAKSS